MIGEIWRLQRGAEVLGDITIAEADFPWLTGSFAPRAGFADVAPLFAEELALTQVLLDDDSAAVLQAWDRVYGRIAETVTLVAPSGPVAEFLLHIDVDEAWFRWSDEPFSEH